MRLPLWPGTAGVIGCMLACVLPRPALAYIGPGTGITLLGTFWTLISVTGVFIAGLLIWPVRSLWQRLKTKRDKPENQA